MMELSKKQVIILFILLLLVLAGVFGGMYYWQNRDTKTNEAGKPAPAAPPLEQQPSVAQPQTVRLLATGDMIAHDSINKNAQQPDGSYDYAALMADMKPFFDKGDVNFCNQATPAGGESFGITGYPDFNAPIAFARGIEAVGCNVINIGTNHTNDKGQALVDATVAAWDNRQVLAVAGANRSADEQAKPRLFEVNGTTFGFVAYTTYSNKPLGNNYGVNQYSDALAKQQIEALKTQADFVIASVRWGTEYSPNVNAAQDAVAQNLADFGADLVFGHGPHVLQPVKKLAAKDGREVYVWYSLGNFLNSQLEVETLFGGFASMEIDVATKKVSRIGFMPVYQHYEWTPAQKAANNLLARNNFKMVPLDQAKELLAKSQLNTTVEAQTTRIKDLLNKFTPIPLLTSTEF